MEITIKESAFVRLMEEKKHPIPGMEIHRKKDIEALNRMKSKESV